MASEIVLGLPVLDTYAVLGLNSRRRFLVDVVLTGGHMIMNRMASHPQPLRVCIPLTLNFSGR
jgi:hypothetical protein